jgi:hypothetical protein
MNLEQIDTSTTAGKAKVMRLAAEGRIVASRSIVSGSEFLPVPAPLWDWVGRDYAIVADPVLPDEMWLVVDDKIHAHTEASARSYAEAHGLQVVCYIRADLAGKVP